MRRMNLNRLETGPHRTLRGIPERRNQTVNLFDAQRARIGEPTVRDRARRDRTPSAGILGHTLPLETDAEAAGRPLASGMVELHSHRAGLLDAVDDPMPGGDLIVVPQSHIARRDTPVGRHRGGLGDDHAESAHRAGHIMLVMERRGLAVPRHRRIRVHRRQPDAVAHGNAAQRHRLEQLHSPFAALGLLLPLSVHGRPFLDNSHGSQSASREVGMLPNHGEATTGLIISPRTDSSTTRAPMFSACAKRRKSGRGRMSVHAHTAPDSRGEPPLSVHRPAGSAHRLSCRTTARHCPPVVWPPSV